MKTTLSTSQPAATAKPDVRAFLDVREFLVSSYEWRKAHDRRFSYSVWADELGIKSRSYLRLLLVGKRAFTERLIPVFSEGLKLNPPSTRYFECLVRYQQSVSVSQKEKLFKELRKLSKVSPEFSSVSDARAFLSSRVSPRIQVLLSDEHVDRTVAGLARLLKASPSETRESLELLERLGLAERVEHRGSIQWRSKAEIYDVPDAASDETLRAFHRRSLEEALTAVELPRDQRKFDSLFMVLSESEYQDMLGEISGVVTSFLSRFTGKAPGEARLYQFNMNLIPVSEPFLHPEKSRDAPEGRIEVTKASAAPRERAWPEEVLP